MDDQPLFRIQLVSDAIYLSGARELVGSVAKRLGFDDLQCSKIALAVAEALYARTVAADAPWPGARAALLARADAALSEGEARATGAGSAPGRIPRAAPR